MSNPDRTDVSAARDEAGGTGMALASRGDALTPYLFTALKRRFSIAGVIDAELNLAQRYLVAALTIRPTRSRWVERFYKSAIANRLRSGNAERQLRHFDQSPRVALQVHALFSVPDTVGILYVDCTHAQSAANWPAWNPLRGRALKKWYRQETLAYRKAEHLFAFSQATKASLMRDYGIDESRVTVTGGGVNFESLPEAADRTSSAGDVPTILFVGNDFVRKGGEVLLEAFREVRRVVPEVRLQLVGLNPAIESQDGVDVLGAIADRERIAELYRSASVFVMPSFFDPYGLVVLEAMAYGVPVIASRQMGVSEMIEQGVSGLVVEAGDVSELSSALLKLLLDQKFAGALASAARAEVEAEYTWDAVVDRMSPVLDRLSARAIT